MLSIRPASAEDAGLLRTLIRELADFERELDSVSITETDLVRDGFGADPKFRALIAEWDKQAAGYAFFFHFYSTWQGRQLFLEDLFVRPQFRGRGIGRALLSYVANIARNENCRAMRWEVLDWNKPAIELYQSLGATFLDDWRLVLLPSEEVRRLAEKAA
ncbi:MAG: GNAT family N-acetyltransferase [Acidobacteria bacterium]|nr:MAG: GNAT family N-acetyltransferase [Acidobacteriota bacterium]